MPFYCFHCRKHVKARVTKYKYVKAAHGRKQRQAVGSHKGHKVYKLVKNT